MWESNDAKSYLNYQINNLGHICNDILSIKIRELAIDSNNLTFLEIGTWNGLGSTKQFVDVLRGRNDDYIFYSLECNLEKSNDAKELYKHDKKVIILNEVIFNEQPDNFYEVFPEVKNNDLFNHWHYVDLQNMKNCNLFLDRTNLPEIFDVVLLDGGEFTTYFEFQKLKNRCKYLILDDINVAKCTKIVEEIKSETNKWQILEENKTVRNGYMICKKIYSWL